MAFPVPHLMTAPWKDPALPDKKELSLNNLIREREDQIMHITAFSGSPRKKGFTARIVEQILEGAKVNGHTTEMIFLSELNIRDCIACRACQHKDKSSCVIRDDIVKVEDAISKSDLIIWASPTHWGNVSACMLRTFERLFGFLIREKEKLAPPEARQAKGKKALLVTSCTTPYPFDWLLNQSRACFDRIREMCHYSGQRIVKTFVLPGTIRMDVNRIPEVYLKKAKNLGLRL